GGSVGFSRAKDSLQLAMTSSRVMLCIFITFSIIRLTSATASENFLWRKVSDAVFSYRQSVHSSTYPGLLGASWKRNSGRLGLSLVGVPMGLFCILSALDFGKPNEIGRAEDVPLSFK